MLLYNLWDLVQFSWLSGSHKGQFSSIYLHISPTQAPFSLLIGLKMKGFQQMTRTRIRYVRIS